MKYGIELNDIISLPVLHMVDISVRLTYAARRYDASLKSKEIYKAKYTIHYNHGIVWHVFRRLTVKGSIETNSCTDNEIYFFH